MAHCIGNGAKVLYSVGYGNLSGHKTVFAQPLDKAVMVKNQLGAAHHGDSSSKSCSGGKHPSLP